MKLGSSTLVLNFRTYRLEDKHSLRILQKIGHHGHYNSHITITVNCHNNNKKKRFLGRKSITNDLQSINSYRGKLISINIIYKSVIPIFKAFYREEICK